MKPTCRSRISAYHTSLWSHLTLHMSACYTCHTCPSHMSVTHVHHTYLSITHLSHLSITHLTVKPVHHTYLPVSPVHHTCLTVSSVHHLYLPVSPVHRTCLTVLSVHHICPTVSPLHHTGLTVTPLHLAVKPVRMYVCHICPHLICLPHLSIRHETPVCPSHQSSATFVWTFCHTCLSLTPFICHRPCEIQIKQELGKGPSLTDLVSSSGHVQSYMYLHFSNFSMICLDIFFALSWLV